MVSTLLQKMKRHNGAVLEFTQEKCDEEMTVCCFVFIVAYANVGFCSDVDVGAYRADDFVLFRVTKTLAAENVNCGKHFDENSVSALLNHFLKKCKELKHYETFTNLGSYGESYCVQHWGVGN